MAVLADIKQIFLLVYVAFIKCDHGRFNNDKIYVTDTDY